jgi:hypothetical protein
MRRIGTPNGPVCEQAAPSSPLNHNALVAHVRAEEDVEMPAHEAVGMSQMGTSKDHVRKYLKYEMRSLTILR